MRRLVTGERNMLVLSIQAMRRLADFDAWLFLGLNRLHHHFRLEKLAKAISFTGDGYLYVLLAIVLPIIYPEIGFAFLLTGLLCFALELPIYWVLKRSLKRRRPFLVVQALSPLLNPSDEFSFPSGHTAAAFMMAYVISVFFPAATVLLYLWASLVGMSRVMLRVHFVSDVCAGAVLGTLVGMSALTLTGI